MALIVYPQLAHRCVPQQLKGTNDQADNLFKIWLCHATDLDTLTSNVYPSQGN